MPQTFPFPPAYNLVPQAPSPKAGRAQGLTTPTSDAPAVLAFATASTGAACPRPPERLIRRAARGLAHLRVAATRRRWLDRMLLAVAQLAVAVGGGRGRGRRGGLRLARHALERLAQVLRLVGAGGGGILRKRACSTNTLLPSSTCAQAARVRPRAMAACFSVSQHATACPSSQSRTSTRGYVLVEYVLAAVLGNVIKALPEAGSAQHT